MKYLLGNTFEMSSTLTESYCKLLEICWSSVWVEMQISALSLSAEGMGVQKWQRSHALRGEGRFWLRRRLLPCLSHWNRTLLSPPLWSSDWRAEECKDGGWGGCRHHCHPHRNHPQLRGLGHGWGSWSGSLPFWLSFFGPPCQPGVYQKWWQHV